MSDTTRRVVFATYTGFGIAIGALAFLRHFVRG